MLGVWMVIFLKNKAMRLWVLTILVAISLPMLVGARMEVEQQELADSVIRLHSIANSDSEADQALKLIIRDAVMAEASTLLTGGHTQAEAQVELEAKLPEICQLAQETLAEHDSSQTITGRVTEVHFPTKDYDSFSLPAGNYTALQLVLGEGVGENWWCVVFPPLCMVPVTEQVETVAEEGGLDEAQIGLMTGESDDYVLKFKSMELWDAFKEKFK